MDLSGMNIWELLVAAASTFLVGFFWYGKPLFGSSWQALVGLTDEDLAKGNALLKFGLSFLLAFLIAFFLSFFTEIAMMLGSNALYAGLMGALLCFAFVATTFGINYLFAQRPAKLYFIDLGYFLVSFFVMGLIIGAWY